LHTGEQTTTQTTREAFWPKTLPDLAQNDLHFGPKWNAFWAKTENAYAQETMDSRAANTGFLRQSRPIGNSIKQVKILKKTKNFYI
jgi:hypothetical protein